MQRWVWGGGKLRMVLVSGLPFGLFIGLSSANRDFLWISIVVGIVFGGFAGVWMTRYWTGVWPAFFALEPADRLVVHRAIRRGERIPDARIAAAVLERAAFERAQRPPEGAARWPLRIAAGLGVAVWGVTAAMDGWVWTDAAPWAFGALGMLVIILGPRVMARPRSRIERAEGFARDVAGEGVA